MMWELFMFLMIPIKIAIALYLAYNIYAWVLGL